MSFFTGGEKARETLRFLHNYRGGEQSEITIHRPFLSAVLNRGGIRRNASWSNRRDFEKGPPPFPVRGLEDFGVAPWGGAGARETAEKDEVAGQEKEKGDKKREGGVSGFRKHGIQEPRWKKW